jgi:excisionase family DNA binding protein
MLHNLSEAQGISIDGTFDTRYVLERMATMRVRTVPRLPNAFPDALAARQLRISRMTLFRKLKDGTISAPRPLVGTRRRWWRPADIETAREQLQAARARRAS